MHTPLSISLHTHTHTLSLSLYLSLHMHTPLSISLHTHPLSLSHYSLHTHTLSMSLHTLSLYLNKCTHPPYLSLNAHFFCDYTVHTLYIYSLHSPAISLQSTHILPIYLSPSLFSLYTHFRYYPITTHSLFLCTDSHSLYTLNSLPLPL